MTHPGSSSSGSSHRSECVWEVLDIVAERTSLTGENELLVMWKPTWVPTSNVADGDILERFKSGAKLKFVHTSSNMRIMIPVGPGTTMAADCTMIHNREQNLGRGKTITAHFASAVDDSNGPDIARSSSSKRPLSPSRHENSAPKSINSGMEVAPTPLN
jgi:hypothetical protein